MKRGRTLGALVVVASVATAVLGGCDEGRGTSEREAPAEVEKAEEIAAPVRPLEAAAAPDLAAHGRELVAKYECTRCHTIAEVEPPPLELDCSGCHRRIMAGQFDADPLQLLAYQLRIHSLTEVPTLAGMDRFRRSWVAGFLPAAHDLRPGLEATMPRFAMPAEDAEALAAFLVPDAETEVDLSGADPEHGRAVMEAKGCTSCHRFTGAPAVAAMPVAVPLEPAAFSRGQMLAPDLRYARERLRPAALVQWLRDPSAILPGAAMPTIPMTDAEIRDVAAFVLQAPLGPVPTERMPERLPVLDRPVTWAEVDAQVFHKICRHCHSDPNEVIGDGGPGYVGGFGFPKRGLDLSTYEGIRSGSLDDEGRRRSVLAPLEDGTPRLVAHLWARWSEVAGKPVDGVRGMPLGLPPLPVEDIQLVESWIAQGRRR